MATIEFRPAVRERVGLIIGMMGGTGSGKTLSALLIARGLCNGDDSKIAMIDTEAGRALHYAPPKGMTPGKFTFGFRHGDLGEPFEPEAYTSAIEAANAAGFEAIVIDSCSHEWNGPGGLDDIHEVELDRLAGEDDGKRERLSMMAWKKPKGRHKRFVQKLLQSRAHLILCFRAEAKVRIAKVKDGNFTKTVVTAAEDLPLIERWVPITEKNLPFELTCSLLFVADKPGVPIPIKLEDQHRAYVPLDRPLGVEVGAALRGWAGGTPPAPPEPLPAAWADWSLEERGIYKAGKGTAALREWWSALPAADRQRLQPTLEKEWKPAAKTADESRP